jgi:hypothetical protein
MGFPAYRFSWARTINSCLDMGVFCSIDTHWIHTYSPSHISLCPNGNCVCGFYLLLLLSRDKLLPLLLFVFASWIVKHLVCMAWANVVYLRYISWESSSWSRKIMDMDIDLEELYSSKPTLLSSWDSSLEMNWWLDHRISCWCNDASCY